MKSKMISMAVVLSLAAGVAQAQTSSQAERDAICAGTFATLYVASTQPNSTAQERKAGQEALDLSNRFSQRAQAQVGRAEADRISAAAIRHHQATNFTEFKSVMSGCVSAAVRTGLIK